MHHVKQFVQLRQVRTEDKDKTTWRTTVVLGRVIVQTTALIKYVDSIGSYIMGMMNLIIT